MENTKATCTACRTPIRNQATNGRPDVWGHTTVTAPHCYDPTPPYDVEQALPRETRKVRIRVEELITYEVEKEMEVHVGVTSDELPNYLALHNEGWADDIEDHFYSACDREVLDDHTFFADDAGYLAKLAVCIEECPKQILTWLTITCPVCGVQPGADDTEHQNVGYFVAIACEGLYVVDPGRVGMDGSHWEDWTKDMPADASGKAVN